MISGCLDVFVFIIFLFEGRSCTRAHVDSPYHLVSTVYCGMRDGMSLFCLTLLVIFKLLAVWAVTRCRNYVRSASRKSLSTVLQKHLDNVEKAKRFQEWDGDTMTPPSMGPPPTSWAPQYGATEVAPPVTLPPRPMVPMSRP